MGICMGHGEEVDDIIADAVQQTYKDPHRIFGARNETTMPTTGNRFAFLQKQLEEEDKIAKEGYKYVDLIKNLVNISGRSFRDLQRSDQFQASFEEQLCDKVIPVCEEYEVCRYRSATGVCNNLFHPTWGMALQAHARYLPPVYVDGYNSPRQRSRNGGKLPSPREISNKVLEGGANTPTDSKNNLILFAFGQFLDHDLTFTPIAIGSNGRPLDCCGVDMSDPECIPIEIPANDNRFPNRSCMDLSRSIPAPFHEGCSIGYREQVNRLSSFIDAGMIYGDSKLFNENLNGRVGALRTSTGDLLPPGGVCEIKQPEDFCQLGGDERVNEVPSLSALHVIFLRFHNILAKGLKLESHLHARSQYVFLEIKKIMGAIIQQVTYGEYLPILLGGTIRRNLELELHSSGFWDGYDQSVNPTVKNVIATAALRYGHSQVPPELGYMTRMFATSRVFKTEDVLMDPHVVVTQNGRNIPDLTRFLLATPSRKVDRQIENAVRNELFRDMNGITFDLMSFNIQRGRDHGLPSYNEWREWCGLPVAMSFPDLHDQNSDTRTRLQQAYDHVDDIDVFVGGMTETPRDGALVGPLFECLLGRQFKDLKFGDRYWYERSGIEGFSLGQLTEIRKLSLSKIICDALGLDKIQRNAFFLPGSSNPLVKCSSLPSLDFTEWGRHIVVYN
ncbi:thyroid peroxidase-like [Saccostrea echinata]|uniref:thyroid peroxidase-like n=1 Tax=Saccostrea echinata TaxID=191078 RepID=UPI002A82FD6F|nr:thyroid peroxidase-like [Saccostrea echinata]